MEVLKVEDRRAFVGHDEVEHPAGSLRGWCELSVAAQAFGQAPGPDGSRGREAGRHFAKDQYNAVLFSGADVGEGPAGEEDFTNGFRGSAELGTLGRFHGDSPIMTSRAGVLAENLKGF